MAEETKVESLSETIAKLDRNLVLLKEIKVRLEAMTDLLQKSNEKHKKDSANTQFKPTR